MFQSRIKRNVSSSSKSPKSSSSCSSSIHRTPFSSTPTSIIAASPTFVDLSDWWLINIDGKGFAIQGFASRISRGVKTFTSAKISKRHCTTIVETSDGITVRINGSINISRSIQNGITSEVCSKFMLGFPYNWEDYTANHLRLNTSKRTSNSNEPHIFSGNFRNASLPSFETIRATTINDLLLSTLGQSAHNSVIEKICSDLLRTSKKDISKDPKTDNDSASDSPVKQKKSKLESGSERRRIEPRVTRSMSRVRNRANGRG